MSESFDDSQHTAMSWPLKVCLLMIITTTTSYNGTTMVGTYDFFEFI